jgi:phosphoribosylcarboxyaminoimidazole (NCAIR) mutase
LRKHAWLFVLGGLAIALAMAGVADAYWTATGTGGGSGPVGTLNAPTISSATPGAGTATLTWSAVTPPGSGSVSYYVQRNGGSPVGNCPTQAAPTSVLTCTDSGLAKGTYTYTVTAVWRSWTVTSSPAQVTLASGAPHHFVLSAATTTPTAGQADNLTITAVDAAGNTVIGYTGSHSLTFSGAGTIGSFSPTVTNKSGAAINFGTATAITFANGVAAVSAGSNGAMTLYKAGTVTVSVTDTSISGTSASITIGAAAANKLSFTQSPGDTTAGVAFASQPKVTVQDQYGNTVTSDTSSVTIAVTGGAATLSGCAANPTAATAGVATFGGCTITTAGTYTLTATDGSLTSAVSGSFTIGPAAANKLSFTQSPGNTVAGVAFASQPQVTVQDQYGNTVTSDTSSVTIAVTGGAATLSGCAANPEPATAGVATFGGCTITTAGTYTLTATDGSLTAADSTAFNITPGAANKLSFTQSPSSTSADNALSPQPKVTVQDQYGNTVTGDSSTVTLTIKSGTPTSGGPGSLTGCSQSESSGVVTFSGCKITTVGTAYQLHATDGSLTAADSTAFNITPGAAKKLSFTQSPGNTVAGVAFASQPKVTVQDQYGNTVTTDTSSVTIAVTGGAATLSGCAANPKPATAGVATFSGCKITTAGTYTLTATDGSLTSAVSGSFTITAATNISQGRPVTCSSIEQAAFACAYAVDGNAGTRWSSAFSDPQWIYVDLGQSHNITQVVLMWETAYGKSFQIQTSNDLTNWTTIYSTTTGTGGTQTLNSSNGLSSGSGRYVRMYGTVRSGIYGYSLYEFQVFGG